jgi:ABC-type antimicrobial peptide transport system permease subunit
VIAGVAPNGLYSGYRRQPDPNFVLVAANHAPPAGDETTLYVRYSGPLDEIVPAIGRALRAVDDRAPIVYVRTMDEQLASLTWLVGALAILLALFAGGSLLIATIGQYAAMAFTMRRRIRDFGVRIALGASSHHIVASVVREGLSLTAVGLVIGGALSLATATALQSMLFGVTPTDAPTYAGVFTVLAAASLVACYVPAHRAARIDPMHALREE